MSGEQETERNELSQVAVKHAEAGDVRGRRRARESLRGDLKQRQTKVMRTY